jgi:hypothetical protein
LTSLPIVLKPKPATVRLEVVATSGWFVVVDSYLTSLPIVLKLKGPPRSDWKWFIELVYRGGWFIRPACRLS